MHFATPFCLGLIAAVVLAGPARPQDVNNPLRHYAVRIGIGHGVYLGRGIVITAAHVAGDLEPHVEIAGRDLTTKVVKRGNDVDLALLSIDEHLPARLGLRHMPLCQSPPGTGQPVFVAIPEGVVQSYVLSPSQLPPNTPPKWQTAIRYVGPGNSGSGVFDANEKCLLGIISRKLSLVQIKQLDGHEVRETHDIAKYFVPASEIAKFIPPEVRF
jgi:S1-C subfamily serine protease